MTPFEQFVAREYGRKEGDPIDDIYDEARARWKQQRTMPMDTNARAAQGVFDSLPDNPPAPMPSTQMSQTMTAPPPAQSYGGLDLAGNQTGFDLAGNRTVFDDLPDTEPLRQSQLTEMEIAQRRGSGAAEPQRPQALPDDLVQQTWRMFADEYTEHKARLDGPIKSDLKNALITDFTQGFAQNYAPILGMTRTEAETLVERAKSEKRQIQMSDWKGTSAQGAQGTDLDTLEKVANVATKFQSLPGGAAMSNALLEEFGVVKPRNVYDEVEALLGETAQLQAAQKIGKRTMPDGTVLGKDEIDAALAETQNKLVGYKSALAMTPSEEGRHLNINEIVPQFTSDKGVNVAKLNSHVRQLAEKYPNLKAHMNGEIVPAAEFQYTIPKAAPEEEEDTRTPEEREAAMTERVRRFGGTLGRAALGVGKGLLEGAQAIR